MTGSRDLGEAMIALVRDLEAPTLLLIHIVCYLLACWAFGQGLARLLKASEDRFHAPPGGGTALCFLLTALLAGLPGWLQAGAESLFAGATPPLSASLGYAGVRGARYDALIAAVLALVALAGLLAFVQGAFMLRAAADGRAGATSGRAFAHMAGGLACWHMAAVIHAVQTSLGIQVLTIR